VRALLVRHGESVSNADPKVSLPAEEGDRLTERGLEQADALGLALKDSGVTDLITSPLGRARQTAETIGGHLGLEIETDDEIHELRESPGYGDLTSAEQMRKRWSSWMPESDPDHSEHGGESFNDVRGRVRDFKSRLTEGYSDRKPLVVTHGIFLRFFLMDSVLGDEFGPSMAAELWNLRTANCGVSVFEHGERYHPADPERPGWVCASWMERPWARP
jgi:ribonuclease H / adenosylcobalamin/alpha-ribazole phosphatase